jgi:hypothetical protein
MSNPRRQTIYHVLARGLWLQQQLQQAIATVNFASWLLQSQSQSQPAEASRLLVYKLNK